MSDSVVTPCTTACQAPLSMGLPRQEYWSALPSPPPGHLPDPGIKPRSPALQVDSLPLSHQGRPLIFLEPSVSPAAYGLHPMNNQSRGGADNRYMSSGPKLPDKI
ncbi:hypothetical protein MJT46_000019 [Ovis ammon polii x Ovis aries]|nr:hypothetical protein MJT46_000019 [Ovis ammon polii x Ovis aries]